MSFLNNLRTFCVISCTISVNLGTFVKIQDIQYVYKLLKFKMLFMGLIPFQTIYVLFVAK